MKRTPVATYRAQKRGGKGKLGMEAREEDFVSQLFVASTHAFVFFFSDKGKVYVKKVYEIPLAARNAKGRAIVNFVGMEQGEKVAAIVEVPKIEPGKFIATITKGGTIKKTELTDYENFREKGIIGVKIEGDDQLLNAALTDGQRQIMIGTKDGMSIRFPEDQVRSMGRASIGVKGIELREGDQVVGMAVTEEGADQVLALTERGYGKRTPIEQFREQKRGGVGVALIDTGERNGACIGLRLVHEQHENHAHHRSRADHSHPRRRDPRDPESRRFRREGHEPRRRRARRRLRAPGRERGRRGRRLAFAPRWRRAALAPRR